MQETIIRLYDQNIDNLLMHIEQTQNAYYVAMDIVNFVHILIFMVSFCLIYLVEIYSVSAEKIISDAFSYSENV